jgi:hypothetical protein
VEIGQPPKDFNFQLAGYTDIAPEEFVYAKTPGGNWIAAAQDPEGRLFMIDEVRSGGWRRGGAPVPTQAPGGK